MTQQWSSVSVLMSFPLWTSTMHSRWRAWRSWRTICGGRRRCPSGGTAHPQRRWSTWRSSRSSRRSSTCRISGRWTGVSAEGEVLRWVLAEVGREGSLRLNLLGKNVISMAPKRIGKCGELRNMLCVIFQVSDILIFALHELRFIFVPFYHCSFWI